MLASRTTKQASLSSSTDQGGGKPRGVTYFVGVAHRDSLATKSLQADPLLNIQI
jgi:hypothetical protein